jgi:hypothetical protein
MDGCPCNLLPLVSNFPLAPLSLKSIGWAIPPGILEVKFYWLGDPVWDLGDRFYWLGDPTWDLGDKFYWLGDPTWDLGGQILLAWLSQVGFLYL